MLDIEKIIKVPEHLRTSKERALVTKYLYRKKQEATKINSKYTYSCPNCGATKTVLQVTYLKSGKKSCKECSRVKSRRVYEQIENNTAFRKLRCEPNVNAGSFFHTNIRLKLYKKRARFV